jgi:hypothetical protein
MIMYICIYSHILYFLQDNIKCLLETIEFSFLKLYSIRIETLVKQIKSESLKGQKPGKLDRESGPW